jgi:hypothetical protein
LFLVEKYAIGQMFARMEKVPSFELLSVGLGPVVDELSENTPLVDKVPDEQRQQLWRKYKLHIHDFECEILEVFPARDMFVDGTNWLDDKPSERITFSPSAGGTYVPIGTPRSQTDSISFVGMSCLLVIALEVARYFTRGC